MNVIICPKSLWQKLLSSEILSIFPRELVDQAFQPELLKELIKYLLLS